MVGMQEVYNNGQEIAELLGWNYLHHGRDTAVLSRFQIQESTPEKTGAKLREMMPWIQKIVDKSKN